MEFGIDESIWLAYFYHLGYNIDIMLRQLRQKKVMKRVLWVLVVGVIIAFVFSGAASLGGRRNHAGIIFGKRVSLNDYVEAWEAVRNEAIMNYGSSFFEIADQLGLEELTWERLIMLAEAKSQKIKASDEEVVMFISRIPYFRDENGVFNQQRYELILNNTFRKSARKFEEDIRGSLIIMKLNQGAIKGIFIIDEEIEEALRKEEEEEKIKEPSEEVEEVKEIPEESEEPETPEERRERVKNQVLFQKRMQALQNWQRDLFARAALVNNLENLRDPDEPTEETDELQEKEEDTLEE